jgi:hypothetical protein
MTGDGVMWEKVWDSFNELFVSVVDELRQCNPQLWAEIGHHESGSFLFNAYVSIGKSSPGEEDLVLNWTVRRSDNALIIAADISRGNGAMLAEGACRTVRHPLTVSTVLSAQADAVAFFRRNVALMKREVC